MIGTETEVKGPVLRHRQDKRERHRLFTPGSIFFALAASAAYLVLSRILIGYRSEQAVLVAIFNTLYFASSITRKFITGFSIFIVYWIIFDYMKAFPNYRYNDVSIASLYEAEKALFGIAQGSSVLTPNEYFGMHHATWADLVCGFFYLCWVPVPLLFAGFMFFRNRRVFLQFALTFFLVNLIGFAGYYLFPAAPPWYVAQYGFDFIPGTPGHTGAALARVDALLGTGVFAGIYSKSSNVFAAMPSMHSAFMLIVLFYSIKAKWRLGNPFFALVMGGIWFSAIYTNHHYILDVLAGIASAMLAIGLFHWFIHKTGAGRRMMDFWMRVTT